MASNERIERLFGEIRQDMDSIVELKDKVDVLPLEVLGEVRLESHEVDDACEVLVSLGLSKNEALKLAQSCYQKGDSAEDIISKSLSQMRK